MLTQSQLVKEYDCPALLLDIKVANILDLYAVHLGFLRFYLFTFRERGREGEKHQYVVASYSPYWPSTQACALTGNQTSNPLVCRPALNPLSHTSQG